ncbi:hypothetical protein BJY01DRAFT_255341 [Aspergillus pseudoustus]|uniref:Uncharacterized protein n=1 Tax=Aspergillus pseudoustus TaxID=1810923 RepID=A0ABR4ILB4_9EURO
MLLRPINLPLPILLSNGALFLLSLHVAITSRLPWPLRSLKHPKTAKPLELFVPTATSPRVASTNTLLGIVTCCLMAPSLLSAYMPIEENQVLAVSVPIRLAASCSFLTAAVVRGKKGMGVEGFWEFIGLAVLDLWASVSVGRAIGRFDGVAPAFA